jgi:hypothetical protein
VVHLLFLYGDGEVRWLAHIDFFLEVSVEEGGLDIHMVDTPPFLSHKREEDSYRLHACNRSEGIIIVDSLSLEKTMRNQPSLVLDHCPQSRPSST